jgi:hypothetical protein
VIKRPRVVVPRPGAIPEKHWVGTAGARDVMTTPFVEALATAGETIREHGVCAFEGEPGLGKTFTALTAAEQLGIPSYYEESGITRSIGRIYQRHLLALKWPYDPDWKAGELEDAFIAATSEHDKLLIIDEIDRQGRLGMEIIRYRMTDPSNKTTFIMVGYQLGPMFASNPAMASRARREQFRPLSRDECLEGLRTYDDIFVDAADNVLDPIALFSGGHFRQMAQVLQELRRLTAASKRKLTVANVKEAIEATRRSQRLSFE